MGTDLRRLHLRLVNALLAITAIVLPLISHYWPDRVPTVASHAISLAFVCTIILHSRGMVPTPRAAQVLIVSTGALALGGSALALLHAADPAASLANETYNSARALVLLTGGAYVTLGRHKGRRAALAALGIWLTLTLTLVEQLELLDMLSAAALVPLLDVVTSTVLVGVLFEVAALNAGHLAEGRRSAKRLAQVDALTGVNNRHGVEPAMAAALEHPGEAALIVLDLDNFKRINDTHGHTGGDRILREVGNVLQAVAREGDAVGRWGGEEFVVVLQAGGEDAAERVARRVRAGIHDIRADFPISASFGVTLVQPADSAESLFKRADGALYEAKRAGRDRIVTLWRDQLLDLTVDAARRAREVNRDALIEASRDATRRN